MAHLCKSGQQPCGYQPQSCLCVIYACRQRKRNNLTELDINKLFVSVCISASCWDCGREVYDEFASSFFYHMRTCFPSLQIPPPHPHHHQFLGLISLFFVFLLQYHCKIEVVALFGPPSLLLCLASCVWVPGIPDRAGSFRCPFQRLNERKKQGRDEASWVENNKFEGFWRWNWNEKVIL